MRNEKKKTHLDGGSYVTQYKYIYMLWNLFPSFCSSSFSASIYICSCSFCALCFRVDDDDDDDDYDYNYFDAIFCSV